jgi:DNA gyrase subunit A
MLAIVNGEPKVLTLKETMQHYIDFQGEVITRRTQFNLRKAKERAHILEGLKIALDFIDEVIAILRASKSIAEGKEALMERFGLDDVQASAIVAMRLGQLTGLERAKIEDELAELEEKIKEYEAILADYSKVLAIVKEEISEVKRKYSDERRTSIQAVSGDVDIEDLIPEEECVVTMTHCGYIKRIPTDVYRSQRRGGRGITGMTTKEEDYAESLFVCSSHDLILFVTNKGKMYKSKCYEIAESSRTSRGLNIVNLLPLESDEKVESMLKCRSFDEDLYVVMVTKKGIIKRTALSAYKNIRASGIIAINLDEDDELAFTLLTSGKDELIVATKKGMSIRFSEEDTRALSRGSRGVKAITLRDDDEVVGAVIADDEKTLLTITDEGFGRKSEFSEYRLQSRGGLGVKNYNLKKDKGYICAVRSVAEDDDVIMVSSDGIIIRTPVSGISTQSRYGGGVRVMNINVDGGVQLVAAAITKHEDEDEAATEAVETVVESFSTEKTEE